MAVQMRGSVKVFVQPENDSFEAMATLFFSSRSVRTWKSSSAPWLRSFLRTAVVDGLRRQLVINRLVDVEEKRRRVSGLPQAGRISPNLAIGRLSRTLSRLFKGVGPGWKIWT